jgi:hypothetical protein
LSESERTRFLTAKFEITMNKSLIESGSMK